MFNNKIYPFRVEVEFLLKESIKGPSWSKLKFNYQVNSYSYNCQEKLDLKRKGSKFNNFVGFGDRQITKAVVNVRIF